MQITVKIKLLLTKSQMLLIDDTTKEYIKTVNSIVSRMIEADDYLKLSSKNIIANIPSALKNQAIRDAKSVCVKYKKQTKSNLKLPPNKQKSIKMPTLKKPTCIWNNQNYNVKGGFVSLPIMIDGKSKRVKIKCHLTDYQKNLLLNKLGTLRITQKTGKWIAQIAVDVPGKENTGNQSQSMGIDLGLKVPAVAVTDSGKTKFFGNGRQNKYMKRKFRSKRKNLGIAKKQKAIKKTNNKEQRWMKDQDHKVSREIINFAKSNHVSVIRLEQLQNIRNTARTSRKNEKNLHTWSFYRLAQYIEYKARLEGITVEYVNPKYTSQTCPDCGKRNHANDRKYNCSCGYHSHRDRVGAINIITAPVIVGKRQSA